MKRSSMLAVVVALALAGCSGGGDEAEPTAVPDIASVTTSDAKTYVAEWFISAESVGADGPGYPYAYREAVDDRTGRYLIQSPDHVAVQTRDEVIFCAAIFRAGDSFCALTERTDGAPPVLEYPLQLTRQWSPRQLYGLASWSEMELAVRAEPDAWERSRGTSAFGSVTECFKVVGETTAANTGFEVCFTDDDLRLVATVDLQGDLIYEIDLLTLKRSVDAADFETNLDEFIEEKESLQEQLVALFPEIPAPRATPTPGIPASG